MNYEKNCLKSHILLCRVLMIIAELLRQLSFTYAQMPTNAHQEGEKVKRTGQDNFAVE